MTDLRVFVTALEASGDIQAARIVAALRAQVGDSISLAGIGGPALAAEGLDSEFPLADFSVIGLTEIVSSLPRLRHRLRQTAEAARRFQPDVLLTVDSWAFGARLAHRLRTSKRWQHVQFAAPKAWAWRPGRARHMPGLIDHLLVQLPFEVDFFDRFGMPTTLVGHPILEGPLLSADGPRFRRTQGVDPGARVLCVLPGSRGSELRRLLPVFRDVVHRLAADRPDLRLVIPTVHHLHETVRAAVTDWPGRPILVQADEREKADAFQASTAALAASGTVTLELSAAQVPTVLAYRVSTLSAVIAARLIRVDYVGLVNLIEDRLVMPEFLQRRCTADAIVPALAPLLDDPAAGAEQRQVGAGIVDRLGGVDTAPSERAAHTILSLLDRSPQH